MTLQLAVSTRNARLDAIEVDAGTSAKLLIYTGAQPANCAASEAGTLLAEFDLASDWAAAASGGSKLLNTLPLTTAAVASGVAAHFRLCKSDGTTCIMQGSVTITSGGGDLELDNTNIAINQTVRVTSWTMTDGNA